MTDSVSNPVTRRGALKWIGGGLVGAAAGGVAGFKLGRSEKVRNLGLWASPLPKVEGIIDTHHHIMPSFYVEAIGTALIAGVTPNGKVPEWSPEGDLAGMDEYGVRKAVLSAPLGSHGDTQDQANDLARRLNDFGAGLMSAHPDRYGLFANLPLPDVDAALKEAAYALDTLKATGVIVVTNYNGAYLGDAKFNPLWEEMNRRKAVVFVHPVSPPYKITDIPSGVLEFVFDTTRTVASLVYAGATRKYPDIKFIFSHGGGTVPFLSSRMAGPARMNPAIAEILPDGVAPELRKLYWDTALCFDPTQIKSLLTLTDPTKVMFGSDIPFVPKEIYPMSLKGLNAQLPPDQLEDILHNTALRIMPGLA